MNKPKYRVFSTERTNDGLTIVTTATQTLDYPVAHYLLDNNRLLAWCRADGTIMQVSNFARTDMRVWAFIAANQQTEGNHSCTITIMLGNWQITYLFDMLVELGYISQ